MQGELSPSAIAPTGPGVSAVASDQSEPRRTTSAEPTVHMEDAPSAPTLAVPAGFAGAELPQVPAPVIPPVATPTPATGVVALPPVEPDRGE